MVEKTTAPAAPPHIIISKKKQSEAYVKLFPGGHFSNQLRSMERSRKSLPTSTYSSCVGLRSSASDDDVDADDDEDADDDSSHRKPFMMKIKDWNHKLEDLFW